jgi:RNA polymerase-binding protein DksA
VTDNGRRRRVVKAQDLDQFKKVLLLKRDLLLGNVSSLEMQALKRSRQDASGDLSTMPIHMADIGSDNFEQEFTLGLIENEEDMLREIDDALERIDEGSFGKCETCGKTIRKSRLKALPHARLCIACKREEELGQ